VETNASGRIEPVNGMEMYCEVRGEGEPLLLVHGFTGAGVDWELIFKVPPRGFQLIVPDLRGHGRSTNPAGTFTLRQCSLDLAALLDRLGIARFKAIGLSGGAIALLHLATQHRDRMEAMVLVSAGHYFPDRARQIMAAMTIESRSAIDWQVMRQRHKHGDDQIRALWAQGNAMKDSYDDVNFTPPLLSTIKVRTLIVHGDRDPFYPITVPLEMFQAIPRASLWVVPNAGHVPVFGHMVGRFTDVALPFLHEAGEGKERRE
jgi:pimeloyl-ACP methyl ester carboxylesterase